VLASQDTGAGYGDGAHEVALRLSAHYVSHKKKLFKRKFDMECEWQKRKKALGKNEMTGNLFFVSIRRIIQS